MQDDWLKIETEIMCYGASDSKDGQREAESREMAEIDCLRIKA